MAGNEQHDEKPKKRSHGHGQPVGTKCQKSSPTNQYGLTDLQWRLVQEYPLNEFNATKSAIAAGYRGNRPDAWAHQQMKKPKVREAIQDLLAERTQYYELSRAWIIQQWLEIAGCKITKLGDNPNGVFEFKQFSKLPHEMTAGIEEISHTLNNKGMALMNVKTNRTKALAMLTKIIGLLEPQERSQSKSAFEQWLDEQRAEHEREAESDDEGEEEAED